MAERTARHCKTRGQRGESIVEGMISMLFLCLILFGLLQIFYLSVAQMLTQYAAYAAARAYSVGLNNVGNESDGTNVVQRVAQTAVVGASGALSTPSNSYSSMTLQASSEIFPLPALRDSGYGDSYGLLANYQSGISWIDYQYWGRSSSSSGVSFWGNASISNKLSVGAAEFQNYPLTFPMKSAFVHGDSLNISWPRSSGADSSGVLDSASDFLD